MSRIGLFGQISEINGSSVDHLFLSGAGVLRPEKLKQKKINCVINATVEEPSAYIPGVDTMNIRIEDNPYAQISHYFDEAADKIRSVKERGGKTLVHCVAGVSRSASLCIIYLVKYERMSLRQAYHYVKSARPIIRPNVGFWKQMVEYERKLRGHASVSLIHVENCPLPFPDVYSSDLRKHILHHPGPAQNDPQIIAAAAAAAAARQNSRSNGGAANGTGYHVNGLTAASKSTIIPIDIVGKRRGLSAGNMDPLRSRHSAFPILNGSSSSQASSSSLSRSPWKGAANTANIFRVSNGVFSPAPNNRRSTRHESSNLFGNLLNSHGREVSPFFSAF